MKKCVMAIGCVGFTLLGCVDAPSEPTAAPDKADTATHKAGDDESVSGRDVQQEIDEAVDATTEFAAQTRDEYVEVMQQRLDELDAKIAELEAKAANLSEGARSKWAEQLKTLKQKRQAAGEKFDELKSSSGEAWKEFRSGVNDAWMELSQSFDEAAQNFTSK